MSTDKELRSGVRRFLWRFDTGDKDKANGVYTAIKFPKANRKARRAQPDKWRRPE